VSAFVDAGFFILRGLGCGVLGLCVLGFGF
jgi:hypothetical protein